MQIIAVIGLILTAGILAFQIGYFILAINEEQPKLDVCILKSPYAMIFGGLFLAGTLLALFFTRLDMGLFQVFLLVLLLVAISVIDLKWHRIPDPLTISFVLQQMILLYAVGQKEPDWINIAISIALFAVLALVSYLSKWQFGMGDVKLITAINLVCGISTTCYSVLLGMILMMLVSLVLILAKKRTLKTSVPFAPYLTTGLLLFYLLNNILFQ